MPLLAAAGPVAPAQRDAADGEVVGLSGAGGEDDARDGTTHEPSDLGTGRFERLAGFGAKGMWRGRIADAGLEEGTHHGKDARVDRGEASVIEIDAVGSGAPALHAATGSS